MTAFFLHIYDYLSRHRTFAVATMVVLLLGALLLSLRLRFQEDVADFLPKNEANERYTAVYNDLGDHGEITILFHSKEADVLGGYEEQEEEVMAAIDDFELNWQEALHSPYRGRQPEWEGTNEPLLRCRMEDADALDAITYIRDHIAIFLTPEDYHRADSLLSSPDYIENSMEEVRQLLAQPLGALVVEGIANDPLNLFSPALQRLQQLAASSNYLLVDGYIFDTTGSRAYAFLESPFASSDTKHNTMLAHYIQCAIDSTQAQHPSVQVSAVGAALIAVTNATQIKHDSFVAIALSLVLIAVILYFSIGRKRNLLWMGFAIAFGWLFALGIVGLFRPTISIIVIGIGSVLVGIAVNYPLHFIDHIKDHSDRREALADMVDPLVIGNITTVSAFACLLFVRAEAMRDLGLFGALMLVGTILFVMLFLPLWVKSGASPMVGQEAFISWQKIMRHQVRCTRVGMWLEQCACYKSRFKKAVFLLVLLLTVLFAFLSTRTSFDADLHHINYMTAQQAADLELLESSIEEDSSELIYLVAEGATLKEAIDASSDLIEQVPHLSGEASAVQISSLSPLLPSEAQQQERLKLWDDLRNKHASLAINLQRESLSHGFTPQAFAPFVDHWETNYSPEPLEAMEPILRLGSAYILDRDSAVCVVSFLRAPQDQTDYIKAHLREKGENENQFLFSQSDVGNNLVSTLSADFNYILYICGFVVFFFLWVSFGNLELSLLAFLPLTVGWFWILGIMNLASVQFNIVNIILATFIFGQGDDYTIFITEGLVQEYAYGKRRLQGFRRSVVLSAVLMFVGMGTLIVARHPAMRSLAEVALIGMVVVVFMACYLPPLIYHWMTHKNGQPRQVPVTLKRLLYTFVSLLVFVLFAFVIVTPLTLIYKGVGRDSEAKRLRYHRFICWSNRMALKFLPGVKYHLNNAVGETFEKSAVIIANHQSHLDLLCMLMLHPKMVIVTNDWVWRNPIYGVIIRYAEFYPASNGYVHNLERMRSLVHRGYSVMIFPEGTRSRDCSVGRFHKGAFQLAQDLDVDILPIYLHGTGQVMPKEDIILREGCITIEVGQRLRLNGDPLEAAKMMRHHYENYYAQLCAHLQNEEYYRPLVRYQYLFKGREVWHNKPGFDVLLHALSHPDEQVVYAPDNRDDALLMQHIGVRPHNLIIHFPLSDNRPSQLIIGGGLSGLFVGAMLAHEGYPVTVLEKNRTIGGGLQCFRRSNMVFPTGMHVFGGFQQGGLLRDFCTKLGIMDQLRLQPTDEDCFDEVHLADGTIYHLPSGIKNYESYLVHCFPEEKESIHAYLLTLQRLWKEELDMLPHSEEFLMPYDQLIDSYLHDEKLRQLQRYLVPLMGAEDSKTPAYILAMVTLSHINGSYQFDGGSQQLADALAAVIEEQDGRVLAGEEVTHVEVSNQKVCEVVTRNGNHYVADNYISAIHPQCLLHCIDDVAFSPAFRSRVMDAPQSLSAFMVFLKCDDTMPYINHPAYLFAPHHQLVLIAPCKGQLILFEQVPFSLVEKWANTRVGHRGEEYDAWKKGYAEELIDSVNLYYPSFRSHVHLVEASSPLTIRDYFGNPLGCLYGNAKDCNKMAFSQLSVRTKIHNLLLTGQNINLHGLVGVAITAQETVREVNRKNEQK